MCSIYSGYALATTSKQYSTTEIHYLKIMRSNKKICVFRVARLKILGRVGTLIFERQFTFQNAQKYFFQEILKIICFSKFW